ncbi:hypothetical protein PHMEG_00015704 [Phytophthora megakarya]|uniref:RxLR effector protein n=1 Tax=Phytophthora megakarya TaxID=4795 RepID=A0A225W0R7_9STRA|nr:hypothetical protein PHMEG_00015704 [Phytophthora megakarya]
MATLLPVLVATLLRLAVLVAAVLLTAAVTNPSDHSFALWISQQNEPADLVPDTSLGVSKWFSAVYQTAKSLVCNEPLTWRFHNALVFSVVHVSSRERYAFGVFGTWRWADESGDFIKALLGGSGPGISSSDGAPRRRRVAESTGFQAGFNEVETESHRQIRAKALQYKVRKDWKNAAVFFLEAAKAANGLVTRANYELEASWCTMEDVGTYPSEKSDLVRKIRDVCDELASAGYFDEASRGLSELALRLKRRFPTDCKTPAVAKEVAELYVQAKNVAEAGGSVHIGDIRRGNDQHDLANEAYGNAVLCRLGQQDIAGAEDMLNRFTEHMGESHHPSDMDHFLSSLLKACNKWSPQILVTASKRYDSSHRLTPWQRKCLANLEEKISNVDLR